MSGQSDMEPDDSEKRVRFGCGALLGVFVGKGLVLEYVVSSFGLKLGMVVAATLVCGFLAMKYGDEFWYSLKDWLWRQW
ncbi:hypothetical protein [Undibacterium sp. Xuan67W]|uniref:hypothetical protein n=1 Tax=Undibacterium sp. Xuan67W TaxID=3413057 RepID=UPI003BF220D6